MGPSCFRWPSRTISTWPAMTRTKIAFLRAGAFCNTCHDVRVPNRNLTAEEHNMNPGGQNVSYFRLENLSTEWQIGPYNSTNNPFGKVVRCQDCHMSLFPVRRNFNLPSGRYDGDEPDSGGMFATDYAAVPGVSTDQNAPLQQRKVVEHYFTGVDVPLYESGGIERPPGYRISRSLYDRNGSARRSEWAGDAARGFDESGRAHQLEQVRSRRRRLGRRLRCGWRLSR